MVSFITLFCKVTFLVKFYWSIYTEKCIYHKCSIGRISTSGLIFVISNQIKKQNMTRSPDIPPDTCPQKWPLPLFSKTILPFFELYYIKILKYLLLKGTIYFLTFRTKLIIYLFTIWKENMYCWPTVAYAWYFKIFGWKFSKNIPSWALVTFSRVTSGLVLLCIWCFGFQGGV